MDCTICAFETSRRAGASWRPGPLSRRVRLGPFVSAGYRGAWSGPERVSSAASGRRKTGSPTNWPPGCSASPRKDGTRWSRAAAMPSRLRTRFRGQRPCRAASLWRAECRRGLLSVHSRSGLHGRRAAQGGPLPVCFNPCRYLHEPLWPLPAGATVAGWDSHPPGKRAFPRRTENEGSRRFECEDDGGFRGGGAIEG